MAAVASLRLAATAPRARVAQERASPPRSRRAATRSSRHVARASSEETPADREDEDEEEVGMDDLVELEMGGVSVSPRGFVALLVPKGSSGSIPRAPNPVEELRDAEPAVPLGPLRVAQTLPLLISNRPEDRDGAVSEWAQAMLQLTQDPPIDMGIQLPYSALDELTGNEGSILGAVFLGEVGFEGDGDAASYKFASTLLAGKEFDQSTYDLRGGQEEAWRALALALRYAPYGCRIFATRKALAGVDANAFGAAGDGGDSSIGAAVTGLAFGDLRAAFPMLQSAKEARAIAAEARKRYLIDPFMAAAETSRDEDDPLDEDEDE